MLEKPISNVFNAIETNDFKRSLFLCEKYSKRAPSNKLLQTLLAFSLSSVGKEAEAEAALKNVLELPKELLPTDSRFINSIIMTLKKMDKSKSL